MKKVLIVMAAVLLTVLLVTILRAHLPVKDLCETAPPPSPGSRPDRGPRRGARPSGGAGSGHVSV